MIPPKPKKPKILKRRVTWPSPEKFKAGDIVKVTNWSHHDEIGTVESTTPSGVATISLHERDRLLTLPFNWLTIHTYTTPKRENAEWDF
jgi:hypothetical protein